MLNKVNMLTLKPNARPLRHLKLYIVSQRWKEPLFCVVIKFISGEVNWLVIKWQEQMGTGLWGTGSVKSSCCLGEWRPVSRAGQYTQGCVMVPITFSDKFSPLVLHLGPCIWGISRCSSSKVASGTYKAVAVPLQGAQSCRSSWAWGQPGMW